MLFKSDQKTEIEDVERALMDDLKITKDSVSLHFIFLYPYICIQLEGTIIVHINFTGRC